MKSVTALLRQAWLVLILILLTSIVLFYQNDVSAAPVHQTVPGPTATSQPTAVPTATAVPNDDDDDDNNDDGGGSQPAPTPTSPPTIAPTATPAGFTATVTVPRLNVRRGPGTNFGVLGVVTSGQVLEVLARNEAGDWWQICCLRGTSTEGWVSADFVQPAFDRGQALELIPLFGELPTPVAPVETTEVMTPTADLHLQIQQDPLYTWQGQEVDLVYAITNLGDEALRNAELRNELPAELRFVDFVTVAGGTIYTETTEFNNTAFAIAWPTLPVDETTVRVRVQVTDTLSDGAVINNLAVVVADGQESVTAGISIGMPPTDLPEFR